MASRVIVDNGRKRWACNGNINYGSSTVKLLAFILLLTLHEQNETKRPCGNSAAMKPAILGLHQLISICLQT